MADPTDNAAPSASTSAPKRKRGRTSVGQSIGGVIFGFEQQVWRTRPPAEELVHHARPDNPIPAKDGGMILIGFPDAAPPVGTVPDDAGADDAGPGDAGPDDSREATRR